MTIDLTQSELVTLEKALDAYERECATDALVGSMFKTMLTPKGERENIGDEVHADVAKAKAETRDRKVQTVLLRAKIYQAQARQSEHTIDT